MFNVDRTCMWNSILLQSTELLILVTLGNFHGWLYMEILQFHISMCSYMEQAGENGMAFSQTN